MGIPLCLFHPRTLQETWENALGWFLPNLAPPECGLHSILESPPVCLLISRMTDPLLQRFVAGAPVWGGTHPLGLWTRSKQVTEARKSCDWGGARVRMRVLSVGHGGFAEQSLRGAWGLCPLPPPPGCTRGLPSDSDPPGPAFGSSLFCILRWAWVLPAGAEAPLNVAPSVLGGAADSGGGGQLGRERGDPPHPRGLGEAGGPTAAGRPQRRCFQGVWKRVSWTVTGEVRGIRRARRVSTPAPVWSPGSP